MEKDDVNNVNSLLGRVIDDKYRLVQLLGELESGNIYSATQVVTGHAVSLKILPEQYAGDEKFIAQLKTELTNIGQLHHPNIVKIADVGFSSINDKPGVYLVMEELKGEMLANWLKRKKSRFTKDPKFDHQLSIYGTLGILTQIASVIDEAHRLGITHQCLTTENIWIDEYGDVKIFDFGMAEIYNRLCNPSKPSAESAEDEVDKSTDIFSLAALAYEMLSGTKPYDGSMHEQMTQQGNSSPPSLREKRWDLPEKICDLIDSALSFDKSTCPPTASVFVFRLHLIAYGLNDVKERAKAFRHNNKFQLAILTFNIWPMYFITGVITLILTEFIAIRTRNPINQIVAIAGIALFTFILFQAQNALTASYALFVDLDFIANKPKVNIAAIIRLIRGRLFKGVILSLYKIKVCVFKHIFTIKRFDEFLTNTIFAQIVSYKEAKGNQEACDRSIKLMSFIPSFDLKWLSRGEIYFIFCICSGAAIFMSLYPDRSHSRTNIYIGAIVLTICLLFYSIKSALDIAYLYLSACKANGEILENAQPKSLQVTYSRYKISKLILITLTITTIVVIGKLINVYINEPGVFYRWRLSTAEIFDRSRGRRNPSIPTIPIVASESDSNLVTALKFNDMNEVNRLIQSGQVNDVDSMGRTPLMMAILSNPIYVDELLDAGSNIAITTKLGTAVHIAARYQWSMYPPSFQYPETNILAIILSRGQYADLRDHIGRTPLMVVGRDYRDHKTVEKIIDTLISAGADINAKDKNGWTSLMHAVQHNDEFIAAALISKGADLNIVSNDQMTAQKLADLHAHSTMRKTLSFLANPKQVDDKGRTTLMLLTDVGTGEPFDSELPSKQQMTTFRGISRNQEVIEKLVEMLIKTGVDINAQDKDGNTALMLAMSKEFINPDLIKILLKYSAASSVSNKRKGILKLTQDSR